MSPTCENQLHIYETLSKVSPFKPVPSHAGLSHILSAALGTVLTNQTFPAGGCFDVPTDLPYDRLYTTLALLSLACSPFPSLDRQSPPSLGYSGGIITVSLAIYHPHLFKPLTLVCLAALFASSTSRGRANRSKPRGCFRNGSSVPS